MKTLSERRNSSRLPIHVGIGEMFSRESYGPTTETEIKDMTPEGALVESHLEFRKGEIVVIPLLKLPNGSIIENLFGVVVHTEKGASNRAGVKFLSDEKETKEKLRRYLVWAQDEAELMA